MKETVTFLQTQLSCTKQAIVQFSQVRNQLVVVLAFLTNTVFAQLYVNPSTGNDANAGTAAAPKQSLRGALRALPGPGTTIYIQEGDYPYSTMTSNANRNLGFGPGQSVTTGINNAFLPGTVIEGIGCVYWHNSNDNGTGAQNSVMTVESVNGFTIRNINFLGWQGSNGSIQFYNCPNVLLENCVFYQCALNSATAVTYQGSSTEDWVAGTPNLTMTINNCQFNSNGNPSGQGTGQALFIQNNGTSHLPPATRSFTVTINNSSFNCNYAATGGALYSVALNNADEHPVVNLNGCTFSGNYASSQGGAVFHKYSDLNFTNTGFCNNNANGSLSDRDGGAIHCDQGARLTVDACVFQDNVAGRYGSAISVASNALSAAITNSIFYSNNAGNSTASVVRSGGAPTTVSGCLFKDNALTATGGPVVSGATVSNSTFTGNAGTAVTGTNVIDSHTAGATVWIDPTGHAFQANGTQVGFTGPYNILQNCPSCQPKPAVGVCSANAGSTLTTSATCFYVCSDTTSTGTTSVNGSMIITDVAGIALGCDQGAAAYHYYFLIVDASGTVVKVVNADANADGEPDLPFTLDLSGIAPPGVYTVRGFLTTGSAPSVGAAVTTLSATGCSAVSNGSIAFTVLDPVKIVLSTSCTHSTTSLPAPAGSFYANILGVSGGFRNLNPTFFTPYSYTLTTNFGTGPYTISNTTTQVKDIEVTYTSGANISAQATSYSPQPGECTACQSQVFIKPHLLCSVQCPTVSVVNAANTICSGNLSNQITTWQTSVETNATNAAAIANANTGASVIYSTSATATFANPPAAGTATGIHSSNASACASETQTTYAYLLCFGPDATSGTSDDTYLLLGTHTLTVNPTVRAGAAGAASGCTVTVTRACASDVMAATLPTGGAVAANFDAATGIYTPASGATAGTLAITFTNASGCSSPTLVINTPACPAGCPAVSPVNAANTICSGNLSNQITTWQTSVETNATNAAAIANANTGASVIYSTSATATFANPPAAGTATGVHSSNASACAAETQTTYAYLLCYGPDATSGTSDDTYLLLGTHTLTVNPTVRAGVAGAASGCTVTVTRACASDVMAASLPTGGAVAANFDAATGVYTAASGATAGTLTITFTNASGCSTPTLVINTPACPAGCPAVAPVNAANSICSGNLSNQITTWQTSMETNATNAAAIANANTGASVIYSTSATATFANPAAAGTATGVHSSNASACAAETQTTYAYLLCYGPDATSGTSDDTYLLLGTHTLTVNPTVRAGSAGVASGCTVTVTRACASDVMAASLPTGGAVAANFDAATGIYTTTSGAAAGTLTITFTNASSCSSPTLVINTPACPAGCPSVSPVNAANMICSGNLSNQITTWQTSVESNATNAAAIASANTGASVIYSTSATATFANPPAAGTATGIHSSNASACAAETQTTYAYLLCYGPDATSGTSDDTYLLLGTHTLTVNPTVRAGAAGAASGCTVTVTRACASDVMAASLPTGGAVTANFDAATGIYTAASGATAGTLTITFTNASGCSTPTLVINTPACPAGCPAVAPVNAANTICSGNLSNQITTWQTSVETNATNAAAIANANTGASVIYSTSATATFANPPAAGTATGVHSSNASACAAETQTTYAYLLCYGPDATSGTSDDTYLLLGTHTLTVNPTVRAGAAGAASGCTVTVTRACASDVMAASLPTGGAVAANFDAATGIYTAASGAAAGTLTITFTNASGCSSPTLVINTPACPAGCPSVSPVNAANTICSGNLSNQITNWQTSVESNATNAAAIANVNTGASVIYSTSATATFANPPAAGTATGIHSSNASACASETQTTYAYLLCYGPDATSGTSDDTYLLLGTHTLTVNPTVRAGVAGAASGCTVTVTRACASDVMAASLPTGGAVAANFDAATGVYTSSVGELPGALVITFSNASGCTSPTINLSTPGCTQADLSLVKTVSNATPNVGQTVTFTITVSNAGPNAATGVNVQDLVPNGYGSITTISNSGVLTGSTINWTNLSIANGGTATLTFQATVLAPTAGISYVNTAQITASGQYDPDSTPNNGANSNGTGGIGSADNDTTQDASDEDDGDDALVLPQVADLSLVKTVSNATPNVGQVVTFTITVSNAGPNAATGVNVQDLVPNGYGSITAISNSGALTGSTINWTNLSIANGGSAVLTFQATVLAPAVGVSYVNTAQITASGQYDPDSTPNNGANSNGTGGIGSADNDTTQDAADEDDGDDALVLPQVADLSLVKTVSNATPNVGQVVTFTITVSNAGPNAASGVNVQDLVPNGYGSITAISNSGVLTGSTINWTNLSIANGGSAVLTFQATVLAPAVGVSYVNTAQITASGQYDPDSTPNNGANSNGTGGIGSADNDTTQDAADEDDGDDAIVIPQVADLSLVKTVSNATPNVGQIVTFTITVSNAGPNAATGVNVQDLVPNGYGSITAISNSGVLTGSTINWTNLSIANGGSAVLTFQATVLAPAVGVSYVNTAQITASGQYDPDSTPNNGANSNGTGGIGSADNDTTQDAGDEDDGDDAIVLPQVADLSLVKTVSNATPNVGDAVTFTITVSNAGPNAATGVNVQDLVPNGYGSITAISNSGVLTGSTINWTNLNIANGGSATLTFQATVLAPVAGVSYVNTAQITASGQYDPDSTPNNGANSNGTGGIGSADNDTTQDAADEDDGDDAVTSPQVADLSLVKTVSNATPNVGQTVTFTITVSNAGPNAATGVNVQDLVPNGYGSITAISNSGVLTGSTINWTNLSIANGGSAVLTFQATVLAPAAGVSYVNTAQITASGQYDPDSSPNNGANSNGTGGIGSADNDTTQDAADEDDGDDAFVVPQVADLSLVKTVSNATPNVGQTVTFTITVSNAGPNAATGVNVQDLVPNGYGSITAISNSGVLTGSTINWTNLSIANGGSATLTYQVTVLVPTPGVSYVNTAQVTDSDQYDQDSAPDNGANSNGAGGIGSADNDTTQDPGDEDDGDDAAVAPRLLTVSCPPAVSVNCQSENEINSQFAAWLAQFSYANGCTVNTTNLSQLTAPDLCGGSVAVTYTASDNCTQSAACGSTFTVIPDTQAPVFSVLPQLLEVECAPGTDAQYDAWLSTHGGAVATDCHNVQWSHTEITNATTSFICAGSYIKTIRFTATDACGNTSFADASFIVADHTPPVFVNLPPNTVEEGWNGCSENASYLSWRKKIFATKAKDMCGNAHITILYLGLTEGCGSTWTKTYQLTATDYCGNSTVATVSYSVVDTTVPVIISCPENSALTCVADVPAAAPEQIVAEDNCDILSRFVISEETTGAGCPAWPMVVRYVYGVSDGCGHTATCEQVITVVDNQAPVLDCTDTIRIACVYDLPTQYEAPALILQHLAGDNCDNYLCVMTGSYTTSPNSITFEAFVKDACGNLSPTCGVTFMATGDCQALCTQPQEVWGDEAAMIDTLSAESLIAGYLSANGTLIAGRLNKIVGADSAACVQVLLPASVSTNHLPLGIHMATSDNDCNAGSNVTSADGSLKNGIAGSVMAMKLNIWYNREYHNRDLGIQNLANLPECALPKAIKTRLGVHTTVNDLVRLSDDYLAAVGYFPPGFGATLYETLGNITLIWNNCTITDPCAAPESKVQERNAVHQISDLQIAPNPSYGTFAVSLLSEVDGDVLVKVTGINGKAESQTLQLRKGANNLPMDFSHLPAGVYSLSIQTNETTETLRLVIVKE